MDNHIISALGEKYSSPPTPYHSVCYLWWVDTRGHFHYSHSSVHWYRNYSPVRFQRTPGSDKPLSSSAGHDPMGKPQAWSSEKIVSTLLFCTFPFWPWPRDLLSHKEELWKENLWQKLRSFWISFFIHLDAPACVVIPNSGHTEDLQHPAGCPTIIFDRPCIYRDLILCLRRPHHWSSSAKLEPVKSAVS